MKKQYMYEQEFRGRRHMPPKQGLDFHTYCDSDLYLWPSDPYFKRGHLLSKANAHVKYQVNPSIGWRVIDRKRFFALFVTVTLTFDLVTLISIGVINCQGQCTCEVSSQSVNSLTSYWSETIFTLIVTVTLTFDLVTPISIGVIYWPRLMHLWSIKPIGQSVDELLIGDDFYTYCDSDLRPSDPNFNRGHLLTKANVHVKYQANRSIRSQVIDRKQTGLPTDRPTFIQQNNIPPLLRRGGGGA